MNNTCIKILFHGVTDRHSHVVYRIGRALGHDMRFIHCSVQIGVDVYSMTWDGIQVLNIAESERYRPHIESITIPASDLDAFNARERMKTLDLIGARVTLRSLWSRAFGIRKGWLCTDMVQVALGDKPEHLSVDELWGLLNIQAVRNAIAQIT